MATEESTAADTGFGRVSRTLGTAFRFVLLAATLLGIVALGILLAFVANDALRPLTANPSWLIVATVSIFLAPVILAAWLYRTRHEAFTVGLAALGLLFVGLLYGGGATILFVDVVPPVVWLSFMVALAIPLALAIALERIDHRVSFLVRTVAVTGVAVVSLWQVPPLVQSIPVLPADWLILWLTIGGPSAGIAAWYTYRRLGRRRAAAAGGLASLGLVGLAGFVGVSIGVGGSALTVLTSVGLLPAVVYVGITLYRRSPAAIGLLLPLIVVGGIATVLVLERAVGLAGPEAWLTWDFITTATASPPAESAGIYAGIVGTILLMINVALLAFPVGVGAAVYLEEYAPDTRFTRLIDVNISNLAGVPSVVYGLLGLGAFIRIGGLGPGTVVVGGLTLALLILPIVIISAREAIRSVPETRRNASYGMGATRWQTVRNVVLPEAFPGILTGTILALGRAVGETAPLIVIGAPAVFGVPGSIGDRVGAIPLQIYAWASTFGGPAFYTTVLAAGVLTIVVILLTLNSIAIVLRNKYQRDA